ncbi:YadA-like family protein, partial [Megasphaera elsdenii]|uniref:YadA-like family protein n=1 Tax=Megasphaera elsdenii TaxID=907 RepID=UPI00242AA854
KDASGKDHPVATLDDGLKFKGDTGDVISKKLNDTLTIKGGQTDASKLSDGKNVGVINEKGALRIELAKKIDLGEDGSVKMGDTTINNNGLTIKNGPTITKTNVSMNNQQIHNVAAGKKGTDAVNVDQLNEVQTLASKHTKVTVEGGTAPKGQTYVGKNLKINVTNSNGQETYDLKLADNLSIGEKGADGKDGKIGVNGKDGSSVVINGKDGTIGLNGKNGTNGLTIRGAAGKPGVDGKDGITRIVYKDASGKDHPVATLDDGLNFKGDDNTVIPKKLNQRMDIVGGANKNNLSENNIGVISDNGKLHVKLAKDLKDLTSVTTTDGNGNTTVQNGKGVTVKDSQNNTSIFTAKDITFTNRDKSHKTKLDEDGLIIFTKGTSGQANQTIKITNTYISMGGQQIHNVLAGKADTDAVNVSQLKAVQSVAEAHSTVSVGGKKAGKDSVDVKGGNLVLKRTENTNGSKNYDVKLADDISIKSVTTTDDKGNKTVQKGGGITTIDKDGNKTSVTGKGVTTVDKEGNKTSLTGKGMTTVDKEGNKTSVTGKGVSISGKDGNKTTITEKGLTIKGGPVVTKDKFSAGGQQIHDVVAGTADTDAVNVSQLKEEIGKVEQHHTEVTVNGGTEAQEGTYNPSGNLQIKKTTDKDTGKKTYDLKLADNLTFGAKDGADGKDGVDGSIGVNGKNGSAVVINGQDGSIGLNGADGKNGLTIKGADGTVGVDGKAGTTRLIYETKDGEKTVKHEVATMDDGMKYSGDSGKAAVKLNKNVQIYGGATEYADGNNIGVVASQDGDNAKLQVKLAKDLKGINSIEAKTITTGDTTMDNSGLTVKGNDNHKDITIHQGNVNMGGNKVSGVADGKVSKDSTDAVNGSQLWQRDQAINGLSGSVNKLGNRINRVGAGAAALAALHPLDFDPDDKWDFAAGYGNYRGANAAAVGAYYRPNEDTMFSVGGSFGGGENMVNAGVSIKLGQGNHVSTSRVAMAKEIKDLRQNVANLNAIVNRQSALIDKLTGTNAGMIKDKGNDLFPDVPANHWAYEYVTKLKHAGILTGYPDGNFDGDRMMTRYEFAAIVYRAIMAGAASNPALNQDGTLDKLANEFSSEMKYIRIDTIAKDKNGKPTIERVRVISDAK